eukprot:229807_1
MTSNNNVMELDGIVPPTNTPIFDGNQSPFMAPNFDLFMNRRRGSSNISWKSNRSFTVTPINIPPTVHNNIKSAYNINPSSLGTVSVSSLDTTHCDTQDFVRSAPVYGGIINGWDQAISSWKSPELNDNCDNAMDLDMINQNDIPQSPEFMKSTFFMPDSELPFSRRTSVESMTSLLNPNQPAPQSAPSAPTSVLTTTQNYDWMGVQQQIFNSNNNEWPTIVTNAFGPPIPPQSSSLPKEPASLTISESDIFGTNDNKTRDRNWSNFTTESENEPIINLAKLSGIKRGRNKSMSDGALTYDMPPQQRIRTNSNNKNNTVIVNQIPPNIYNNNNLPPNINVKQSQPRRRGRPRKYAPTNNTTKKESKYAGLKKAEREKLRRKELKEGYQTLTKLLNLNVERSGASLPDRSVIVSRTCEEIKRLENKLFELSMQKKLPKTELMN